MRAVRLLLILLPILAPTALGQPAAPDAAVIAEATGGWLTAANDTMFDANCNQDVAYEAEVVDLDKDGQPEVFTKVHGTCWGGGAGVHMNLLIKGRDGQWRPQFGFPGIPHVLESGHLGFPDIEIGGPGFCFPVWRWNGQAYALHKTCPH